METRKVECLPETTIDKQVHLYLIAARCEKEANHDVNSKAFINSLESKLIKSHWNDSLEAAVALIIGGRWHES